MAEKRRCVPWITFLRRRWDIIDVGISFHGTWMTKGHPSPVGIGFVLEASYTRIVTDFEALFNCLICQHGKQHVNKRFHGSRESNKVEEAVSGLHDLVNYNHRSTSTLAPLQLHGL